MHGASCGGGLTPARAPNGKETGTAGYLVGRSASRLRSACDWSRSEVCVGGVSEPGVRRPGEVVRSARVSSGLTLAELGNRTGYSAAQVSRYERGVTPLTDVTVLRRFARALAIPPGELGLAVTGPAAGSGRALAAGRSGVPSRLVPSRVAGEPGEGTTTCADGSSCQRRAWQQRAR